jgi:phage gpG-like protein
MAEGLFTFEFVGSENVKKSMLAMLNTAKDLRPFWRDEFAPRYFGGVQDLFETGGRTRGAGGMFSGGAWAGLTPVYRAWKQKMYPGKKILQLTGALQDSLTWSGTEVGPGGIFDTTENYVRVGTTIPYGKYLQEGTSKMVARPFLPAPNPAVFAPILKSWLLKAAQVDNSDSGGGDE